MEVIDTEVHVMHRVWPIETSPSHRLVERLTWHEHSGDLLVEEMDRAGVNRAFLIGYDGADFGGYMRRFESAADQFWGGRSYTRHYARKHSERFAYFTTLRDPRTPYCLSDLAEEFGQGAAGIKIFPSYLELPLDDESFGPVYEFCSENDLRLIIGLEDTDKSRTSSHEEYWDQVEGILRRHPQLRIQFNHGGAVHLPSPEADAFFRLTRRHANVFVSTSYLGGPFLSWQDEWRYPFPEYLRQLRVLFEGVGPEQLVWASDWPWLEEWTKYPQLIDAVRHHADFIGSSDLEGFLGGNAERFLSG